MAGRETMALAAKGRRLPPPILDGEPRALSIAIQSWPGVIAATHWLLNHPNVVDGADFYCGVDELGHIHLDGEVHLATSTTLREALLANGLARPFPYYRSWVETSIGSAEDARHAEWLFRLNYDRLSGATTGDLLARIESYAATRR